MAPIQLQVLARHQLLKTAVQCTSVVQCRGLHESSLPMGSGGRSSFSGIAATVFGCTGTLGGTIVNRLGRAGSGITAPHRGSMPKLRRIQIMGDLGQIQSMQWSMKQTDDEIRKLIEYSNCVVNAIGCPWDLNHYSMEEVNYEWPLRLARLIAEKNDGTRLLQLSYLNCHQEEGRKVSRMLDQKYRAEIGLREIYPDTIIARSSQTFGFRAMFTQHFQNARYDKDLVLLGALPLLYDAGKSTVIRPCYEGDVAQACVNMLKHLDAPGKTFELMGPDAFLLHDFVERLRTLCGLENYLFNMLGPMDRSKASGIQKIVGGILESYFDRMHYPRWALPRFLDMPNRDGSTRRQWTSKDYYKMIHLSDIGTGKRGFADLGIVPSTWDSKAYRLYGLTNAHGAKFAAAQERKELPPTPTVDYSPTTHTQAVSLKF